MTCILKLWYSSPRHRPFVFFVFFFAPKDFKIIWLSIILALGIPEDGYSRNACTKCDSYVFNLHDNVNNIINTASHSK